MAVDLHVVQQVGEHHLCGLSATQACIGLRCEGISADQAIRGDQYPGRPPPHAGQCFEGESLLDPSRTGSVAAFLFEELQPRATTMLQAALRGMFCSMRQCRY